MKFGAMKPPSKFLAKEDLPNGKMLVTVRGFSQENLGRQGQAQELKWIIHFNETPKGMVLNPTNQQLLCMALGIDPKEGDTNEAIGKKVVIWNDMSVRGLDGNLVGGLRIRAANLRPAGPLGAPGVQHTPVQPQGLAPVGQNLGWPTPQMPPPREPGSDDDFDSDLPENF